MKILVVSGFLGAGKTTFIKALAKYTGKEFAVLENEYGASFFRKGLNKAVIDLPNTRMQKATAVKSVQ